MIAAGVAGAGMSMRELPDLPSLESLLNQAKDRARDSVALADAQLAIAREYGLRSWLHLVSHLTLGPEARKLHEIDLWFQGLPDVRDKALALREVLEREAQVLCEAHRAGVAAAARVVRSTRRKLPAWQQGKSIDETDAQILASELGPNEARQAIARWRGFAEWSDVLAQQERTIDPRFEAACDAIVVGDSAALRQLLEQDPALVRARSPFPHSALLIHYVAANGIENNRQWQSPKNAVEIAQTLLSAGADPNATCTAYSERDTVLGLLVTSAHPAAAGVQADLVEVLCRAGAKADGPDDDGGPLWSAITSGYTAAAERLASCGARVDNIVFAAAIGDLGRTCSYFDDAGRLRAGRARSGERIGTRGPALDEGHMLEYALIFAAGHGRREVVELLLTKGPDLGVREPLWRSTALGQAEYHRRVDVVALLKPLYPERS
jgi:ankyrin repeat protein